MIEVKGLTKRYGDRTVVDGLSFAVEPGVVTGFLGPNGAGKSTTMRMILGLDAPTAGTATVNGRPYRKLGVPLREIGALLDPGAAHPGRTARTHLTALAYAGGITIGRVSAVLEQVGLVGVAERRIGTFSLGMRQRLGIAVALLGDPRVVLFDEPLNGLDPEGIHWLRTLMRELASEGRTVFVSSHLMNEMEETADHVVVIGKGELLANVSMTELRELGGSGTVTVVAPDRDELTGRLARAGGTVLKRGRQALVVRGLDAPRIGEIAASARLTLHELTPHQATLETAFLALTGDSVQHRAVRADGAEAGSAGGLMGGIDERDGRRAPVVAAGGERA